MELTTTHLARWLIAILAAAAMIVTVGVTGSRAESSVKCEPSNLVHTVSDRTGGSLISFQTSCTGNGVENLEVDLTTEDFDGTTRTWFAAVDNRTMTGQFTATRAIHLPIKVPARVCVTVNGQQLCLPPS